MKETEVNKKEKKGTKERIQDVAIDLFSQKGYNAVSIRDIASLVEIHESTIYSHYKGKEDIMDSIIDALLDEFKDTSTRIPLTELIDQYSPEKLLKSAITPMILRMKESPKIRKILRLMLIELYQNQKFLNFFKNLYIEPSYALFSEVFQLMMDKGLIKEYNPEIISREFFNFSIYLLFEAFILNYDEDSQEQMIDNILNKLYLHIKFIFDMLRVENPK